MGNYTEPGRGSETRTFRNIYQVGKEEERGSSGSSAGLKPILPTTVTAHAQVSAFILLLVTDLLSHSWVFAARLKLQLRLVFDQTCPGRVRTAWRPALQPLEARQGKALTGTWLTAKLGAGLTRSASKLDPFISYFQQEQMWIYPRAKQGRW